MNKLRYDNIADHMNRRTALKYFSGLSTALLSPMSLPTGNIHKRLIPSTGELLPCVGVGTWQTFDVGQDIAERRPLLEVLKTMVRSGATVIDSSPMYGSSESVVGELSTEARVNEKLFIATKVWTTGAENGKNQMNTSFQLLRRKQIELMQIHNLTDWRTHLKTLQQWKEEGRIRYIGLTHYLDSSHETIENIIEKHKVDFIQINYSIMSRHAEQRLLPVATDLGVAVITNRPFEEGALFERVKGKELPAWTADFNCASWAQFFLKFILSGPGVTCVIPGTSKVKHLVDNLGAGAGRFPDKRQREKMIDFLG